MGPGWCFGSDAASRKLLRCLCRISAMSYLTLHVEINESTGSRLVVQFAPENWEDWREISKLSESWKEMESELWENII